MSRILVVNPNCSRPCSDGISAALAPFRLPGGPDFDVATLAEGPSGQIPLNPNVDADVRVETPQTIRAMQVDWPAAADSWDAAAAYIREEFTAAE